MSNREHIILLNLGSHKDGIDSLDNNRYIAGSAGNVNPASLSKSAATAFCIALSIAGLWRHPRQSANCLMKIVRNDLNRTDSQRLNVFRL